MTALNHDVLRAIGHNIAASLADGYSVLTGTFEIDVPGALLRSPTGYVTADFLSGSLDPAAPGTELEAAVQRIPDVLPELCRRHSVNASDLRELRAIFRIAFNDLRCTVIVSDALGRRSETEYKGFSLERVKTLCNDGSIGKAPIVRSRLQP